MEKLVQGVHKFQQGVFSSHRALFERLKESQAPDALFVTCSDSRVVPNLLTQTEPGELFVLQNAGNLIPSYSYGGGMGAATATIEYAIVALKVKDIIVCGHSRCGAMHGLLNPELLDDMPAVKSWLGNAEATRRIIKENYTHLTDADSRLMAAVEENVLVQLENLRTHPSVAAALARRELHLHGWVYRFETGEVFAYDIEQQQFVPLAIKELAAS